MAGTADAPLQLFVSHGEHDLPLSLYRRTSGVDVPVSSFIRAAGVSPVPYTVSDLLAGDPFYVAHRCGGGNWPEFSQRGILGSIGAGYKALEMSVYRCGSGEFVLSHDWTTTRMTGQTFEIWQTPWSTLGALTSTAEYTSNPAQSRTPLLKLDEALQAAQGRVVFIDHKPTSGNESPNQNDLAAEEALLDYLDTIEGGTTRFVWKTFKAGWASADRAKARGYQTWGAYYGAEINVQPDRLDSFDILGLAWYDAPAYWTKAHSTGKPTIAHIVSTSSQRSQALDPSRAAEGIMCTVPQTMGPLS